MKITFLLSILGLALASPLAASVLLVNPGFEQTGADLGSGLFAVFGWTNLSNLDIQASSAPEGFEGTGSSIVGDARYLRLATDNRNLIGDIQQNTGTISANHTYTLFADIFGGASNGALFGASILFTDGAGFTYASVTYSGFAALANTTGSLSYTATLADEGKPFYIELKSLPVVAGASSRGGIDSLELIDADPTVPEPATLALLALPLLALLKRRHSLRSTR